MALVESFRVTLSSGTMSETTAIEHLVDRQGKVNLCLYSDSANVRIKVKYVFDAGTADEVAKDIKTIDLTSGTLELLNFDFPTGMLRVTYDDTGSSLAAEPLKIDLHTGR